MKPLVLYCRWQRAKLRLGGREEPWVWGEMVLAPDDKEIRQPFRFNLETAELILESDTGQSILQLDDMGVVIKTSAGDEPQ